MAWIEAHYAPHLSTERLARTMLNFTHFSGTPDQLLEKLRPWCEAGLGYGIFYFADAAYDHSGFELFAREVAANL